MEGTKYDGDIWLDIDGAARNWDATDRTSLRGSRDRRVKMLIMVSSKCVVGMDRYSMSHTQIQSLDQTHGIRRTGTDDFDHVEAFYSGLEHIQIDDSARRQF